MIYLDNAATTKTSANALEAYIECSKNFANAGSPYSIGRDARGCINTARQRVAALIGANPEEIIFTSSGTESNNLAIIGFAKSLLTKGHANEEYMIISSIEHDSVIKASEYVKDILGIDVEYARPIGGIITVDSIKEVTESHNGHAVFVSVMHTNNETGLKNDVEGIGDYCCANNIYFHTDCVQAASSDILDVNKLRCHYLSLSSHKMYGVKGVGALFVRKVCDDEYHMIEPIIYGGSHQEFGIRGGTENVPGIASFGVACRDIQADIGTVHKEMNAKIRIFIDHLLDTFSRKGFGEMIHINSGSVDPHELVKTVSIRFDGIDAETIVLLLGSNGVFVSAGSACRSYESEPSRVLTEIGLTPDEARNTIRVSIARDTTIEDLRSAVEWFLMAVKSLHN